MDQNLEWREAQSGSDIYLTNTDEESESQACENDIRENREQQPQTRTSGGVQKLSNEPHKSQISRRFSFEQINLNLCRNIASLADPNQHKPKLDYEKKESFDSWLENALVAISPNADYILFSGRVASSVTFLAKLRMDPINQYSVKPLNVSIDYDEEITSLLCLPIMSTQRTAMGSVDWTVFFVGLSSGYVKFYTENSTCLLSLKFLDEPVNSIKCQTKKINTNARSELHFATIVDEILITYKTYAIIIDGLSLLENLRIAKNDVLRNGDHYEPAYNLTNMPCILNCQKWKLEDSLILDGELLGTRLTTTFDSLKSESINSDCVRPKNNARALAFVGRNPFLSCYYESRDTSSHSYSEMIGSIFSLWSKPQPSQVQITDISKPSIRSMIDKDRRATSIVASPDKRMSVLTDDFGRILLVDVTNWLIIRMWKGYRSAQCGWIEAKKDSSKRNTPYATLLVIYAPKRGLLEVWSAQRGPRIAAFSVGKGCRLLYSGYKMLNMRTELLQKSGNITQHLSEQSYASHCYLLNPMSETIFAVELPYTYSLYRYGDFKSRDHLLITELATAIEQNLDVEVCSEIINRISLPESLHKSIERVALGLEPKKVTLIMENLILRIMRNYDNQSGELLTHEDEALIELCKRAIRLCTIFNELSDSSPRELVLPNIGQNIIEQYERHPQEIADFSERLGWSTSEVLRCLSLLALEKSFSETKQCNLWPNLGEPLSWFEFVRCFDLSLKSYANDKTGTSSSNKNLKLRDFDSQFLRSDRVVKTALFIYNRQSEAHCQTSSDQMSVTAKRKTNIYDHLDPASRLLLLFQFWQSTRLCDHWEMWTFLQSQADLVAVELKTFSSDKRDEKILVDTWKRLYQMILESDNLYGAIIAITTLRTVTLKIIHGNDKLNSATSIDDGELASQKDDEPAIDWEHLCVDAERLSIVRQQLEDIYLLNLLLRYSFSKSCLVSSHIYRIPRISVANVLRGGPTIVSELVAQWIIQSGVSFDVITRRYGQQPEEGGSVLVSDETEQGAQSKPKSQFDWGTTRLFEPKRVSSKQSNDEQVRELIHHVETAFPCSLEPDVVLLNCVWELCRRWTSGQATSNRTQVLGNVLDCLSLIGHIELKHKLASVIFKTFFQLTFERLVALVEANSTIVSAKNSRVRDALTRRELNMSEDCLESFVKFCCDLTEFMMQSLSDLKARASELDSAPGNSPESYDSLLALDHWWLSPSSSGSGSGSSSMSMSMSMSISSPKPKPKPKPSEARAWQQRDASRLLATAEHKCCGSQASQSEPNSLVRTTLLSSNPLSIDMLVELNKLSNLMNLIFKLKVTKAHPMSLIGEQSRQTLRLDLKQTPLADESGASGHKSAAKDKQTAAGLGSALDELRRKFVRKCILSVVCKLDDESSAFSDHDCHRELEAARSTKQQQQHKRPNVDLFTARPSPASASASRAGHQASKTKRPTHDDDDDAGASSKRAENNEAMVLFSSLLSIAVEWQLDCDELHLELVFELYRCNHDKLGSQLSRRVLDQRTLASGLLKIASQRVLVLAALSPSSSGPEWRSASDKWSRFAPNVASWLKKIQSEEMQREIPGLSFGDSLRLSSQPTQHSQHSPLGLHRLVLLTLAVRTKLLLDRITNHLEGQAARLARDLLQVLDSQPLDQALECDQ